jgi:hypothetical protein
MRAFLLFSNRLARRISAFNVIQRKQQTTNRAREATRHTKALDVGADSVWCRTFLATCAYRSEYFAQMRHGMCESAATGRRATTNSATQC